MARIRSHREQKRRANHILMIIAILSIISITIALSIFFYNKSKSDEINHETLCPTSGAKGHYVLLIDKTEPLNQIQKNAFKVTVKNIIENETPEGYMLSVFVLGEDFTTNEKPIVELCNPGNGNNKSEFTSNLKKLNAQYQSKFIEPLITKTEELLSDKPAKNSPIFEMLQLVDINGFKKQNIRGEHHLIIISDMLHNTPQYSMYKNNIDYPSFRDSNYGIKSQAELPDVKVQLFYLMNQPKYQTRRNTLFWEEYFKKSGAQIIFVKPLEG
jgi:hypothetical protein